MYHEVFTYVLLGALAIALVVAAATDLKSRTIGNKLNLAIAAGAPLFWWASEMSLWPGVAIQLAVAAATFAVCCVFFALRQMGGGDVKLLTALALWMPPSNFLSVVVITAMLGWVLTLIMGAWAVANSKVVGARPIRDTGMLIAFTLVAANFASGVVGGPRLTLPSSLVGGLGDDIGMLFVAAMAPILLLAGVTLASIRIIKRHEQQLRVPYGLAISIAGLSIIVGSTIFNLPSNTIAG
ncbi:potassium:proton antiporter [Erythrobacter litoralis]|uniref:A24 family peptidase n=1 Tax=Erythrobacter litoralis TaxID=39960 RepID=UPI0024354ED8|nr:prepilin peptidase [Erythrobacter litoralis]MDG6077683.1 potassium:proton antiporter [Erythrobacter litoralis]